MKRTLSMHLSDNPKAVVSCVELSKICTEQLRRSIQNRSRRLKLAGFAAIIVALTLGGTRVEAQQAGKIPWVGYLAGSGSAPSPSFIRGMRDLGYEEGKNIAFVYRTAEGRRDRFSDIAAELVRLKVDVIVANNTAAGRALKKATNTIPIVMTSGTDLVADGLVTSYARPGGNVTGLTNVGAELGGKLLELLKEITPKLSRVAFLGSLGGANAIFLKSTEVPAQALGIQLIPVSVNVPDDIDAAFRTIAKERANGVLMRLQPSLYASHFKRVAVLTASNRLPSIAVDRSWVDAGGLLSYGSDLSFQYRRAAAFVDKSSKERNPPIYPLRRR